MKIWAYIFLTFLTFPDLSAQEFKMAMELKGNWKFSIGDDSRWSKPELDDANWEEIYVPSSWEDQGFHGYDGYGWYRLKFNIPANLKGKHLYLFMGNIDDVDQVYINGQMIGSTGKFPPYYETAYFVQRKYPIPANYINYGSSNVIAVRVYDSRLSGGIQNGPIGLYSMVNAMAIEYGLEGEWKFKLGDDLSYKEKNYKDGDWETMFAPGSWDAQGLADYDGFGWYRKKIVIPEKAKGKTLVLVLGRIDDIDQVYVNGKLVGQTGNFNSRRPQVNDEYWRLFRGYYVPEDVWNYGQENTIAIRVYDNSHTGGIYTGPLGLTTSEKYTAFWKKQKRNEPNKDKNFWDWFFN